MKRQTRPRKKAEPKYRFGYHYHPDFLARGRYERRKHLFGDPATFTERLKALVDMTYTYIANDYEYRWGKHRPNTLYKGDNLQIMRQMPDHYVDLVYLDPPFNTDLDWFVEDKTTGKSTVAFTDKWEWNDERQKEWDELQELGQHPVMDTDPQVARSMQGLQQQLGERTPMLAYLTFMAIRIRECRRVMK